MISSGARTGRRRTRGWLAAAVAVGLLAPGAARAQNSDRVSATYDGLGAKAAFTFKLDGVTYTRPVGRLNWTVAGSFGTAGLERTFSTFCAEPLVGVTAGGTYPFRVTAPDDPAALRRADPGAAKHEAEVRATYLRELFARYFAEATDPADPDGARAFQVALWELATEAELPAPADPNPPKFSLATGTFRSDYPDAARTPAFVARAEEYLRSLGGNDLSFAETYPGRELVRLSGVPDESGARSQDQYALRLAEGGGGAGGEGGASGGGGGGSGGAGAPGADPNGANGRVSSFFPPPLLSNAPIGSPSASLGQPFGGSSGAVDSFGPRGSNTPISPLPPSGTNPPPPGIGPSVPPPPPPVATVPTPAGLLLGGIGVVILLGRRAAARGGAPK